MRPFTGQLITELRLSARNGEQLLVSLVIPVVILVFFSTVDVVGVPDGYRSRVDFIAPGVLALAVMSSAMVSLAIGTGFERHYGVLKRLGATPLGRGRWLGAKVAAVLVTVIAQVVVLSAVAVGLGWRPDGPLWQLVPALLAGTAAFAGLGLLMAGTLRATVTLAAANGLYVILLLLGDMVFPLENLPGAMATIARLLPAAALTAAVTDAVGTGLTAVAPLDASGGSSLGAWVVLGVWAVALPALAARLFRWE
jgi:ABC-2 type transport system permease protein